MQHLKKSTVQKIIVLAREFQQWSESHGPRGLEQCTAAILSDVRPEPEANLHNAILSLSKAEAVELYALWTLGKKRRSDFEGHQSRAADYLRQVAVDKQSADVEELKYECLDKVDVLARYLEQGLDLTA